MTKHHSNLPRNLNSLYTAVFHFKPPCEMINVGCVEFNSFNIQSLNKTFSLNWNRLNIFGSWLTNLQLVKKMKTIDLFGFNACKSQHHQCNTILILLTSIVFQYFKTHHAPYINWIISVAIEEMFVMHSKCGKYMVGSHVLSSSHR